MYKVSVITPFHNVDMGMFEKCVESMRCQTIGFENIENGMRITEPVRVSAQPRFHGDAASARVEPIERVFNVPMWGGGYAFFRLLKKGE